MVGLDSPSWPGKSCAIHSSLYPQGPARRLTLYSANVCQVGGEGGDRQEAREEGRRKRTFEKRVRRRDRKSEIEKMIKRRSDREKVEREEEREERNKKREP